MLTEASFQRDQHAGSNELPSETRRVISKLWLTIDALADYPETETNRDLLRRVIEVLHDTPLSKQSGFGTPEETWIDEQCEKGVIPYVRRQYVLDCLTSEARYDQVEKWGKFLLRGLDEQECEVPAALVASSAYGSVVNPYHVLKTAFRILPDNPKEMMGDVWLDRAIRLGLIPGESRGKYLDIYLAIRDRASALREEERMLESSH